MCAVGDDDDSASGPGVRASARRRVTVTDWGLWDFGTLGLWDLGLGTRQTGLAFSAHTRRRRGIESGGEWMRMDGGRNKGCFQE